MIKVFTLLQSPSWLSCSSMAIMYVIQDFLLINSSSQSWRPFFVNVHCKSDKSTHQTVDIKSCQVSWCMAWQQPESFQLSHIVMAEPQFIHVFPPLACSSVQTVQRPIPNESCSLVLPGAGGCSQWAVAPFPFLSPTPTQRSAALLLRRQPSSPLLTWSCSHQRSHNGVWSVKTFNWEAGSFELHRFQLVQTGDVWLSLHLMSKQTWAACRCWVPFAVFHLCFTFR